MKAVSLLALLAVLAVALAGCSGSGGGKVPDTDAQGRYVIHMTSANKFSPPTAEVPVGSTVVWVHDGGAPHDVHADDGSFSSGPVAGISAGESWAHEFNEVGTFPYQCHVHDGMRGTLIVVAADEDADAAQA